ncbi:LysM peptidoglycan-binding domain-containing protein [Vibrio makurazakiensis]|uniref:LysM peptidoglycan-binding domain-containing protein n=1 Tax=Vibrio makurazakiensis TaxID=2910250 RepID=UPI003D10B1F0
MKKVIGIVIASVVCSTFAFASQETYISIKDDTAYSIAKRFDMSVDELADYNPHWINQVGGEVSLIPVGIKLNVKSPVLKNNLNTYKKSLDKKLNKSEINIEKEVESEDGQFLTFNKGDKFSKRVLDWCAVNDMNCIWESKYDFRILAKVSYLGESVKDNIELIARDLYLNRSKVKIQYYSVNDVYRFYN